jgi:DNA-binding SARP family transcriptional activator
VLANPAGTVQVKVSQLRRALEEAETGGRALIVSRGPGYVLGVDDDAVDAARFEALVARARQHAGEPGSAASLLDRALALWRGPALADFADEAFARTAITRLDELRVSAREDHFEARLALGDVAQLTGDLEALVAEYPLRERLRGLQMRALYAAGRQAEALATYEDMRVQLRDELGVDPSPELARLFKAILNQDPELTVPGVVRVAARPRTNLPAPVSSLVGRSQAAAEVRDLIAEGRLVTLTGPGGVGKTRLALEAAARLVDDLADGVWFVELAEPGRLCAEPSDDVDCLAELVTRALGLRDDTLLQPVSAGERVGVADRLATVLRDKRLLLLLDNCEHVIESVAKLADRLLRSAPGVRILARPQR